MWITTYDRGVTSPRLLTAGAAVWLVLAGLLALAEHRRTVRLCAFGPCGDPISRPFRWSPYLVELGLMTLVVGFVFVIVALVVSAARSSK